MRTAHDRLPSLLKFAAMILPSVFRRYHHEQDAWTICEARGTMSTSGDAVAQLVSAPDSFYSPPTGRWQTVSDADKTQTARQSNQRAGDQTQNAYRLSRSGGTLLGVAFPSQVF